MDSVKGDRKRFFNLQRSGRLAGRRVPCERLTAPRVINGLATMFDCFYGFSTNTDSSELTAPMSAFAVVIRSKADVPRC